MNQLLINLVVLVLLCCYVAINAATTTTTTTTLDRSNLQKLDISSLRDTKRQQITSKNDNNCKRDTQILGTNTILLSQFHRVLSSFNDSFELDPHSFCTATTSTTNDIDFISTHCIVDYSVFTALHNYKSTCVNDLGSKHYPISMLMRCSKNERFVLEMEFMNIPSCIGKSCTHEDLYDSLMQVVSDGIELSTGGVVSGVSGIGGGEHSEWSCDFYHDFASLRSIPMESKASYNNKGLSSLVSLTIVAVVTGFYFVL